MVPVGDKKRKARVLTHTMCRLHMPTADCFLRNGFVIYIMQYVFVYYVYYK